MNDFTKKLILSQYIGQDVEVVIYDNNSIYKAETFKLKYLMFDWINEFLSISVIVKHVSDLSDEHATECLKMICGDDFIDMHIGVQRRHIRTFKDYLCENDTMQLSPNYSAMLKVYQYLISWGYAVPYKEYSVNDLVSTGIFKILK